MEKDNFNVILLGIIYDPEKREILVGKGNLDSLSKTGWCFPGGKLRYDEDLDKKLKKKIKEQTGYEVKNLGSIFARIPEEEPNVFIVYFLCEIFRGKEKVGAELTELKWIEPHQTEEYFEKNTHTRLKEYFMNLDKKSF